MASGTSSNVGSSSTPSNSSKDYIILFKKGRNADVWEHYELVLRNEKQYALCLACHNFYSPASNTTLRRHLKTACVKKRPVGEQDQMQIDEDGQNWIYNKTLARLEGMQMVIQEGLPFNLLERPPVIQWIKRRLS